MSVSDPSRPNGDLKRGVGALVCFVLSAVVTLAVDSQSTLEPAAVRALFILLVAASLWVTEVVPPFAVGILVIAMKIALLGRPEGVFATSAKDWEQFVAVLGHPLVWLFFGGFVLAAGMQQCGLDRALAKWLLSHFGTRPAGLLLGVMSVTFVLSMFLSNTATTAMMLAILAPATAGRDSSDRFSLGLLVGCAVAANLGGLGSLIGSPPNAIAVGALADKGITISFLQWSCLGLPPALVSMGLAWFILLKLYPASAERIELTLESPPTSRAETHDWRRVIVSTTLMATLGMWLTSQWHGVPTAAVALLPIVIFTTTRVLSAEDIRGLNYDVLFLLAGGLALGQTLAETGLSNWLVELLPLAGLGEFAALVVLAAATLVLSNVMSNTAAANVLVPIGLSAASGFEAHAAMAIAFGASAAMCLPVATPPNAMVFSTGKIHAADFLKIGVPMGVAAPALGILWIRLVMPT